MGDMKQDKIRTERERERGTKRYISINKSMQQLQMNNNDPHDREFVLTKIHTIENGSDMLTKVLTTDKLQACRKQIGLERRSMPE